MSRKIRVLVVDDSALVRSLLTAIIDRQRDMVCVGAASDPLVAREMVRELRPDVLTLDVEMPRMDGLDFLGRLMRLRPMPVVMVSTQTARGADVTLKALELGAVDFVAKPRFGLSTGLRELASEIVEKVRIAAVARFRRPITAPPLPLPSASVFPGTRARLGWLSSYKVVCIGASTGGTEAIRELLSQMPPDGPAIVITQHMPAGFTASFAARLNGLCRIAVKEACHGDRILPGHAYIAPGGRQLRLSRSGVDYVAVVDDGPPVNRHRPSVEVLFLSAAEVVGRNAYAVMLTGMGGDGARAMRVMHDKGAYTYAQDEASCIVFGMPREAIAQGAVDEVLPLTQIAPALLARLAGATRALHHRI